MGRFDGKVAWVTGGGSGIGLACVLELAKQGAKVVVSGRRADKLDAAVAAVRAAGGEATALVCDVTRADSVADAVATIVATYGSLDVLLANAGFSVRGKVAELSDAEWRRQFDTNVFGLLHTVRASMPELLRVGGRVALVGSVASFVPAPNFAAYGASKAAVRAIGEAFSIELRGTGVSCTTIHPGYVESEIAQVNNEGQFDPERKDRRPARLMWKAEPAARVMVQAIADRKVEFVFTGHGRFAVALSRLAPGIVRRLAG
jgi:NAD(P)-dependent dehydrogenase (short-subunit alcohol dehydrogenase family)